MSNKVEKLIKALIGVENNTRIGKYNVMWSKISFLVWFITLASGFSFSCKLIDSTDPLKGFSLKFGDSTPVLITIVTVAVPIICAVGLLICYNKGWINKEDF